jgi:hypothetical protein
MHKRFTLLHNLLRVRGAHSAQKMRPHARQWCRRRRNVKDVLHLKQPWTALSGTQDVLNDTGAFSSAVLDLSGEKDSSAKLTSKLLLLPSSFGEEIASSGIEVEPKEICTASPAETAPAVEKEQSPRPVSSPSLLPSAVVENPESVFPAWSPSELPWAVQLMPVVLSHVDFCMPAVK